MLRILDTLPPGLLQASPTDLEELLDGPTLIHLAGRRQPALFVSVLMHGNETTGFDALQRMLLRYRPGGGQHELPRSLSVFIGNVSAARQGLRRLADQPDYNRVWPAGRDLSDSPERSMMIQVVEEMRGRGVFASVDVHNNTGLNPHYGCVNRIDNRFLQLASLFSRTVVYFVRPDSVQSMSFAALCPAVTLECGQPGARHGVDHALEYLEACLHLSELPNHAVCEHDIDLFHTVATVKIPEQVRFAFGRTDVDLCLVEDLDHMNFTELPAGTQLGTVYGRGGLRLDVVDELGKAVADRYFTVVDGELRTRVPVMPSMLTLDERVIRQDCLCYLMERYRLQGSAVPSEAHAGVV
jgi:hypothetical protein